MGRLLEFIGGISILGIFLYGTFRLLDGLNELLELRKHQYEENKWPEHQDDHKSTSTLDQNSTETNQE